MRSQPGLLGPGVDDPPNPDEGLAEAAAIARGLARRARNDRILKGSLAAYGALLVVLTVLRGVQPTPLVLAAAVALLAILALHRRLPLRDWIPFVVIALAYELISGYQAALNAIVHVTGIVSIERALLDGGLATAILQGTFHPLHGVDPIALAATILYLLHGPLPLAVALFLWVRRRAVFDDYMAALLILSLAAFSTYLLLPVAPPWWAAQHGYIVAPDGSPLISYLQPAADAGLLGVFGFGGQTTVSFGQLSPDQVASFPSVHAAYPFLAYLFSRQVLGRARWLVLAYAVAVWFAVIYLGDHYLVDVIGGIAYASAAYWAVQAWPSTGPRLVGQAAGLRARFRGLVA